MRFVLDENVPNSVGVMLGDRGHTVASIREYVAQGAPDQVVAAVTEYESAVAMTKTFAGLLRAFRMVKGHDFGG